MRDFYDIHILLKSQNINVDILALALERTAKKRGNFSLLENAESVLKIVKSDEDMKRLWNIYQKKFKYAGEYTWDEVIHSVRELSIEAKLDVVKHC